MKINDTTNTMAHHVLAHLYARRINEQRMSKENVWAELKSLPEPIKTRTTDMMKTLIKEDKSWTF
jgi:hypothetical protein